MFVNLLCCSWCITPKVYQWSPAHSLKLATFHLLVGYNIRMLLEKLLLPNLYGILSDAQLI